MKKIIIGLAVLSSISAFASPALDCNAGVKLKSGILIESNGQYKGEIEGAVFTAKAENGLLKMSISDVDEQEIIMSETSLDGLKTSPAMLTIHYINAYPTIRCALKSQTTNQN